MPRTYPIKIERVQELQRYLGWTDDKLAREAGISAVTLSNWLNRRVLGAYMKKIRLLAKALQTTPDDIIELPVTNAEAEPKTTETNRFDVSIKLAGVVADSAQLFTITRMIENYLKELRQNGIEVITNTANVSIHSSRDGETTRIITHIFGLLEDGARFWVYASVRPSMYSLFQTTYAEGKLDLYRFETFGEILLSGRGEQPPEEVVRLFASMGSE